MMSLLMMFTIGTAQASPGEIGTGELVIGETRDGSSVHLPVCIINGVEKGKTLYIQAVSDGNELNGLGVIQKLVPDIDPKDISGTIMIVPIVNKHGFHVNEHRNPIDDKKINRTYPGDKNGSSSERIASHIFEIAKQADIALDLHQGSNSQMVNEVRVRCGSDHKLYNDCLKLAEVFNIGNILNQKGPDGQFARAMCNIGVPTINPELGGSVGYNNKSIQKGINGIKNILIYHDFIEGNIDLKNQDMIKGFQHYSSPSGGLVHFSKSLNDDVRAGEDIFSITDVFGNVKGNVTANYSGTFWRCRRLPQAGTGEYVCSIGID